MIDLSKYRRLKVGEEVKKGDYLLNIQGEFIPVCNTIGAVVSTGKFYRPVEQHKCKCSCKQTAIYNQKPPKLKDGDPVIIYPRDEYRTCVVFNRWINDEKTSFAYYAHNLNERTYIIYNKQYSLLNNYKYGE